MGFCVWVVKTPGGWTPTASTDNPPEAEALMRIETPPLAQDQATGIVQGFNEKEIKRKLGLWAIVFRIGAEPTKGQTVKIASGAVEVLKP